jgi:hypothetical protein
MKETDVQFGPLAAFFYRESGRTAKDVASPFSWDLSGAAAARAPCI